MSGDEPIELPGLAAARSSEPGAAVCRGGHVISWFIEPPAAPRYCVKCGDPVLVRCPSCNGALPGDPDMLGWVPYFGNCPDCGKAYPWKAGDVARAKRTLAEQADVEGWSESVKTRADELVDDIAADRAMSSGVVAALNWLAEHGAAAAREAIVDAIEHLGSPVLKQRLRADFPGRFQDPSGR